MSDEEREALKRTVQRVEGIDYDHVVDALSHGLTQDEMRELATQVPEGRRTDFLLLAGRIASAGGGLTAPEEKALEELREALHVEENLSDFDFPEKEIEVENGEQTVDEIAVKYAKLAGAIAFVPVPVVSDSLSLVVVQAHMVRKIAGLYNYPINAKEFLKKVSEKAGLEYTLTLAGREVLSFVPVAGWALVSGITFQITYAFALLTRKFIERKGDIDDVVVRETYNEAYEEGRKHFDALKDEIFETKDKLVENLMMLLAP